MTLFPQQFFSVDLDSIYDGPINPLYVLSKVEMEKRNLFQLVVELHFYNVTREFYSEPFLIRSKTKTSQPKKRKISAGQCPKFTYYPSKVVVYKNVKLNK